MRKAVAPATSVSPPALVHDLGYTHSPDPVTHYRDELSSSREACSCPPCGAVRSEHTFEYDPIGYGQSHNGYWSFMGRPGSFCESSSTSLTRATTSDGAEDDSPRSGFASIARSSLRGKRVLIFGDSVMSQVFFAALCDLRRDGLLNDTVLKHRARAFQRPRTSQWPFSNTFIDSPSSLNRWDLGLVVPDLHLNLTLHGFVSAAELFCASREKDLRELRARVGSYNFTRRLALRQSTHCDAFWSAAARDFDVILANPTGVGPTPCGASVYTDSTGFDLKSTEPYLRAVALPLQARAAANASKAFAIALNSAQHFGRTAGASSGLYRRGDESMDWRKSCACVPSAPDARDPRNDLETSLVAQLAPALRVLDTHALTRPLWFMHIARTVPEHTRGSNRTLPFVCDCTHYCYLPGYWRERFFPALRSILVP